MILKKLEKKVFFFGWGGVLKKKTYFLVHLLTQRIKPMSELEHFVIPLNRIKKINTKSVKNNTCSLEKFLEAPELLFFF